MALKNVFQKLSGGAIGNEIAKNIKPISEVIGSAGAAFGKGLGEIKVKTESEVGVNSLLMIFLVAVGIIFYIRKKK